MSCFLLACPFQAAARRIADAIMLAVRAGTLPERTRPFAELVARAKGKEYQAMHPAKMTFQALRIHLNQEFGFRHVGTLKEVGRKFGKLLDVHVLQKMLNAD